jgi:peroxiredoxin
MEGFVMLDVGKAAPDFTLKSHENEAITLSSFKGDKWVVLHTFPVAFTGG